MDETEEVQRILDKHRVKLVDNIKIQSFLDKMRSQGVLSREDCELMLVSSLYPTDRQRASHFLDVIATKGQRGYNAFLECLDEHYPHLYKTVTGKEATIRPQMPMSPSAFNFSDGFGSLLSEISNHNHQLQHQLQQEINDKKFLEDERNDLASQNTTFIEKLKNYQKVLENYKQLEIDLRELKDELLDLYIRLNQTEKDRDKWKALSKQKSEKNHEYEEKLSRITNLLYSQKHSLERTSSKNEQLSQEKNQLQQEVHHIKMEMEKVRRQSSISLASFKESIELDKDIIIEMCKNDKEVAERQYEDVNKLLYDAQQEIDRNDLLVNKLETENQDLKYTIEMIQKDLSATERNYQLMWQELQITNRNCNNALEQRNQAQAELLIMRKETEQRQYVLQEELFKYKKELQRNPQDKQKEGEGMTVSPFMIAMSGRPVRASYMSSSSGVSSARLSEVSEEDVSESNRPSTLPREAPQTKPTHRPSLPAKNSSSANDDDDIQPIARSRKQCMVQRENSGTKLEHDTFPESEIPSSEPPAETDSDEDDDAGSSSIVVRSRFVERPELFTDSMQARHGSQRKSKEFYETQDCMLDEMRKSVALDRCHQKKHAKLGTYTDFTLDYEDESEELARIVRSDYRLTMKPYKPKESSAVDNSTSSNRSIKPPIAAKKPSTTNKPVQNGRPFDGAAATEGIQPTRNFSLPNNIILPRNGSVSASVSAFVAATAGPVTNNWQEQGPERGPERGPRQISRKRLGARKSNSEEMIGNQTTQS